MPRWPDRLSSDMGPEELERAADKILESDRVNRYQKDKRAVVKGLQELQDLSVEQLDSEDVKKALRLTVSEVLEFHKIANGHYKGKDKRNIATRMAALKLLLDATVEKPKQLVEGEVGVQVVVQTMKREYELPAATSTAALPPGTPDAK